MSTNAPKRLSRYALWGAAGGFILGGALSVRSLFVNLPIYGGPSYQFGFALGIVIVALVLAAIGALVGVLIGLLAHRRYDAPAHPHNDPQHSVGTTNNPTETG
ncbi:hypothetical protein ACLTEW_23960 [Gordonia lacunae]|uniref:hypothetical protein n=1 Tax=Gordonia lacunae TaxID=417102 RepID=UPI0039E4E0DE